MRGALNNYVISSIKGLSNIYELMWAVSNLFEESGVFNWYQQNNDYDITGMDRQ